MQLLAGLNDEQLAAVTLPAQHALIIAGAGSGKTRVLTTRIAWLIASGQAAATQIMAVTFTNKAAREMLARLGVMTSLNVKNLWVGTFHGLAHRLLRAHWRDAGLPQGFQIMDAADQLAAIKRLLKALGADDEKFPPKELAWFINAQKEAGLRPEGVEAHDDYTRRRVELYAAYEAQCMREGVVDFAELMLRSYELLARNEPLRLHYQRRFRHILVDEFQDTNRLQYQWLKRFVGEENALFCVGDDDQSIYAFRGAEVANMHDFVREFEVANLIRLERNYRSHGNILAAANAVIANNPARLGKNLWTEAPMGEPIRVYAAHDDAEEARFVVEEIQALTRQGMPAAEIAVLYRSNAQSRALEHALFSADLPYRVYGGLRFFERAEIKHALAYLRLVANPHDDTAFLRVVNFPARGIGARTIEQLSDVARAAGTSLYAAIEKLPNAAKFAGFCDLIQRLRAIAHLPLPELVEQTLEASGLRAHYRAEREGQERLANLDELVNAAAGFVAEQSLNRASNDSPTVLLDFLAHASLEAGEHQADEGRDAVQLMTVHAAKGLEFDVVFVCGLEEGLFPHEQSLLERGGLEEERRLMYVAVTRAKRLLYLSHAQTRQLHGQTRYAVASRFLEEIPIDLLKPLTMRSRRREYASSWALPARSAGHRFHIGQSVRHSAFGEGVIIALEGGGRDARAQINFGAAGIKWLALSVAKLEVP
ncbi:MAG: UvrD-helicase domain-containing protein [Rhodocyclaceae bacterium]|nr:UvrD-helicase domain-containing protein [Rhodocyclaceae bacterium]